VRWLPRPSRNHTRPTAKPQLIELQRSSPPRSEKSAWENEKREPQEALAEAVEDLEGARASLRQMVRAASTDSSAPQ
ncbi:hypothetical protein, partial [Kitasatospora sp. NPDC088346]|uniref:hypothetical protein n=1 Tax=Kitasatospora sp. NPDC088346 TaxID=3364073 RepID=UPI0037F3EAD7